MAVSSILDSTKKYLGIVPEYTAFDDQVIDLINTSFSVLYQLGVGPSEGFAIDDSTADWDDYLDGNALLNMVRSYVHKYVKLHFDPPTNSFATQAMQEQLNELTWRINVAVDPKE